MYNFNLRKLDLTAASTAPAGNPPDQGINLATSAGTVAISKSAQSARLTVLKDNSLAGSENDFDDEVKLGPTEASGLWIIHGP